MITETIAAISTAMNHSGIGIIRISGNEAFEIADRIYKSKGYRKKLSECESHTIHYGYIYDQEDFIDEVLVMIMRGPRSYTAEDTIEINCHGGVYSMKRILETAIKFGARPAEPGEFTKRAFLNGRIDLSQAEAVMDVIKAKNEYALKSSLSQLKGSVYKEIKELRSNMIYQIAFIESALDDPEHISFEEEQNKELKDNNYIWQSKIKKLIDSSENGKRMTEGIQTVIVGKPNAGKSSLLNLLLGEERAIVTEIAGTTRDVLQEQLSIHGISLNIMDTAGIRKTDDIVEKIGVDRAKTFAKDADLIIFVMDSSTPLDDNDREIIKLLEDKNTIVLLNKTDLEPVTSEALLREIIKDKVIIPISTKTNSGMENLERIIKEMFYTGTIQFNDQIYITNMRHKAALLEASESLKMVQNSIEMNMPEDFLTIDLMNAYRALGSIIGEAVEEDLVNEIFAKFCMGK